MLRQSERLLKAAADRTRLRILKMLEPGPLCVCQIVQTLGMSQSAVSRHLSVLVGAGLAEDEPRGKWTYYRLARPDGEAGRRLLSLVRCCAAEDPEVARDLEKAASRKIQSLPGCCPPRRGAKKESP
jgi:ArsR family transcriptional regulator